MSSQEGGRKIRDEWACLRGERPSRGARSALERGRGVSEREGRRTLTKPPTLSQAPAHTESTNACATRRDTDTLVTDAGGQCGSPGRPRACPAPHEWRGPASVHLRPLHARDSSWKTGQLGSATGGSGVHDPSWDGGPWEQAPDRRVWGDARGKLWRLCAQPQSCAEMETEVGSG